MRAPVRKILVWDVPTRRFHRLLVASVAGAFLTADSERRRDLHGLFGSPCSSSSPSGSSGGLGTRYARFASFAFGTRAVLRDIAALATLRPVRRLGHTPAGSRGIWLMLGLALLAGATGRATYAAGEPDGLGELHGAVAWTLLGLVAVHVAAGGLEQPAPPREPGGGDDHRPEAGRAAGRHPERAGWSAPRWPRSFSPCGSTWRRCRGSAARAAPRSTGRGAAPGKGRTTERTMRVLLGRAAARPPRPHRDLPGLGGGDRPAAALGRRPGAPAVAPGGGVQRRRAGRPALARVQHVGAGAPRPGPGRERRRGRDRLAAAIGGNLLAPMLARTVLADVAPLALARGVEVELGEGPAVLVPGDRGLLAILVRNPVDNAVRSSPPGRAARVDVGRAGGARGARGAAGRLTLAGAAPGRQEVPMRPDLVVGGRLPDLELPDHRGQPVTLSRLAAGFPLIVSFYRGYW